MTATIMVNSTAGIAGAAHSEVSLSIATPIAPMLAVTSCCIHDAPHEAFRAGYADCESAFNASLK